MSMDSKLTPETLRLSVFDNPDWELAFAINKVMCEMTPGLSDADLDPVQIRSFPPVRHLKPGPSTDARTYVNNEELLRRRRVIEDFLGLEN